MPWMLLYFKSPPSPPLSSTLLSLLPPRSHHSINPPICYAVNWQLFYYFTLFKIKLQASTCANIQSLQHPSIQPSSHPATRNLILLPFALFWISDLLLFPSSSSPTSQMKQSQLRSHFTGGRTDHTITIIDYIKQRSGRGRGGVGWL